MSDIEELAAAFDQLSKERDPKHHEYVIAQHHSKPEAFRWFLAGVTYGRAHPKRRKEDDSYLEKEK